MMILTDSLGFIFNISSLTWVSLEWVLASKMMLKPSLASSSANYRPMPELHDGYLMMSQLLVPRYCPRIAQLV